MKPSDHLVAHAGIPQAALLLDAPSLCLLLDRQVELVHVRIKPCHNVLVAWRDVATGEHGWTEATGDRDKFDSAVRRAGRISQPVTVHEEGEILVFSGSVWADRKLAKPLRELHHEGLRVLRYNPQRRLVVATADGLVVRVHADSAAHLSQISARWQRAGLRAISMLGTANMSVSPWWGIGDLQSTPSAAGARAAGREVARLHGAEGTSISILPIDIDTSAADIAPWLADSVRALGKRLAVLLPEVSKREPLTELHGDLSPDQVLVNEHGEIRLIDFDRAGGGPAARDLGSFLAACRPEQGEEFLRGYREAGGKVDWVSLAVWEAYAHLNFALAPLRRGAADWPEKLRHTLDLAWAALDLVPPRSVDLAGEKWLVNRAWRDGPDGLAVELKHPDTGQIRAARWNNDGLVAHAPGADPRLAIPDGQVVSHRLRKRAVVRSADGASYIKIVRAGKAAGILDGVARAGAFAAGFRMPQILAHTDSTVTFAALEGRSMHVPDLFSPTEWEEAWAEVLGGLQKTWAAGSRGGPVHTADLESEVLRTWVEKALAFVDAPGALLEAAENACAGLAELPEPELVPSHRDLHSKQLLWSKTGGPGLLDVDTACRADRALDLGNLRAHALWRRLQGVWDERQTVAVLEAIDQVNVDPAALAAYQYATLVRLVCVYAFRPKYRAQAMELLGQLS